MKKSFEWHVPADYVGTVDEIKADLVGKQMSPKEAHSWICGRLSVDGPRGLIIVNDEEKIFVCASLMSGEPDGQGAWQGYIAPSLELWRRALKSKRS